MVARAMTKHDNRHPKEEPMARQVKCECGYIARGETDDDVVAEIRDHLRSDHPELDEKVSDEKIRDWVEIIA
jgi:predicted small metal-binding protein